MSAEVPVFVIGDYVRVMDTRIAREAKIANVRGTLSRRIGGKTYRGQEWLLQPESGEAFRVLACEISKTERPPAPFHEHEWRLRREGDIELCTKCPQMRAVATPKVRM